VLEHGLRDDASKLPASKGRSCASQISAVWGPGPTSVCSRSRPGVASSGPKPAPRMPPPTTSTRGEGRPASSPARRAKFASPFTLRLMAGVSACTSARAGPEPRSVAPPAAPPAARIAAAVRSGSNRLLRSSTSTGTPPTTG
jgi:hypothetical protein